MSDLPIYRQLADEYLLLDVDPGEGQEPATVRYGDAVDWVRPPAEPTARTAGEQDHADPWAFAGADADPPGAP